MIVDSETIATEMCDEWEENADYSTDTCQHMSTSASTIFYLTVSAYSRFTNARLQVSGPNLVNVEEVTCWTEPDIDGIPLPCIFPFIHEEVSYNECAWSGNGTDFWCSTKNDDANNLAIERGNCGRGCPRTCLTVKNSTFEKPCVFPFISDNISHTKCAWSNSTSEFWCSIQNDIDGFTIENGTCGLDCPIPEKYHRDLTTYIGDAAKSLTKTFLIKCEGKCRNIAATIEVDSGDPDLFAREDHPQQIGRI